MLYIWIAGGVAFFFALIFCLIDYFWAQEDGIVAVLIGAGLFVGIWLILWIAVSGFMMNAEIDIKDCNKTVTTYNLVDINNKYILAETDSDDTLVYNFYYKTNTGVIKTKSINPSDCTITYADNQSYKYIETIYTAKSDWYTFQTAQNQYNTYEFIIPKNSIKYTFMEE
jgi:hypothetical protein